MVWFEHINRVIVYHEWPLALLTTAEKGTAVRGTTVWGTTVNDKLFLLASDLKTTTDKQQLGLGARGQFFKKVSLGFAS